MVSSYTAVLSRSSSVEYWIVVDYNVTVFQRVLVVEIANNYTLKDAYGYLLVTERLEVALINAIIEDEIETSRIQLAETVGTAGLIGTGLAFPLLMMSGNTELVMDAMEKLQTGCVAQHTGVYYSDATEAVFNIASLACMQRGGGNTGASTQATQLTRFLAEVTAGVTAHASSSTAPDFIDTDESDGSLEYVPDHMLKQLKYVNFFINTAQYLACIGGTFIIIWILRCLTEDAYTKVPKKKEPEEEGCCSRFVGACCSLVIIFLHRKT